MSPILYKVADRKKSKVLHHDRLKPCSDRDIPLWLRRKRSRILSDGDSDFSDCDQDVFDNDFSLGDVFREEPTESMDPALPAQGSGPAKEEPDFSESGVSEPLDEESSVPASLPPSKFGRKRVRPRHLQDYTS